MSWFAPRFPLEGGCAWGETELAQAKAWRDGAELCLKTPLSGGGLILKTTVRVRSGCPFLRLRYDLEGAGRFAGRDGWDVRIDYGGFDVKGWRTLTELRLSSFDRIAHCFLPNEERYTPAELPAPLVGPMVLLKRPTSALWLAYEHGAEAPDHFLEFVADGETLRLCSSRGNFFDGQAAADYRAPWLQLGLAASEEELRAEYRRFVLEDMAQTPASRAPKIFYNTWNRQERRQAWAHVPYLEDMRLEHMLEEVEVAHRMGVEVFVLDTGWYGKTGDWLVNLERFPDGLKTLKAKLDEYGMELGLWFNPVVAARSSEIYAQHPEYGIERDGKAEFWGPIWETEESFGCCIASGYGDYFIEKLCQLHDTLGVSYFKWDAIGQYGCDSDQHAHGGPDNPPEERRDAYAYRMGLELCRIAGEVSRRTGGIVDFDITEGGRAVGLGFLAVGKYFLMNNGPYFSSFDVPKWALSDQCCSNVFFYPGAARNQVCRQNSQFDSLIPSVLFLTHFLPEGSEQNRKNAMAALALGGNGLWGDLTALSEEEIGAWADFLCDYKRVRDAVTRAAPIQRGRIGGSPEIHEKLDADSASGLVACFTRNDARFTHITRPLAHAPKAVRGVEHWEWLPDGRLKLDIELKRDEAKVIFVE